METPIIMNMTFGKAFAECVNNEKIIGRKNEEKYVIIAQVPAIIGEDIIPKMSSLNKNIKELLLATCGRIHYHNQLLKINLNTGEAEQYIPTAEDLFAIDWRVIDGDVLEEVIWRFNKDSLAKTLKESK